MAQASLLVGTLKQLSDPKYLTSFKGWFKTEPGQYSEHEHFLGVRMPDLRKLAKQQLEIPQEETKELLSNSFNEARMLGWLILCYQYKKGSDSARKKLHNFSRNNVDAMNNWNLVDAAAPILFGEHLAVTSSTKNWLLKQADSSNLWRRRVAIVSTLTQIRQGQLDLTLAICKKLLNDKEDLIHKACGWMLREAAKQDRNRIEAFLAQYINQLPRTTLRYAIERFSPADRKMWLNKS